MTTKEYDAGGVLINEERFRYPPHISSTGICHNCAQGACTDGTYLYVSLLKIVDYKAGHFETVLQKRMLSDGSLVMTSALLPLSHCNDMCYDPYRHELIIPTMDGARLVRIDPETLTVIQEFDFCEGGIPYAIAYEPKRRVCLLLANGMFNVLDENFRVMEKAPRYADFRYVGQGLHATEQYILMPMSKKQSAGTDCNVVLMFDWSFRYLETLRVETSEDEIETLFDSDGHLYAAYNSKTPSGSGGVIAELRYFENTEKG